MFAICKCDSASCKKRKLVLKIPTIRLACAVHTNPKPEAGAIKLLWLNLHFEIISYSVRFYLTI